MFAGKTTHVSPLSNFAHNAKAECKKSIYIKALQEAKEEQLRMMQEGRKILAQTASV